MSESEPDSFFEVARFYNRVAAVCVVVLAAVLGCGDRHSHAQPPRLNAPPLGLVLTSPRGVVLEVPAWPGLTPAEIAEALAECDACAYTGPGADPSKPPGVPVPAVVTIMDPGSFSTPFSSTGLATGETDCVTRHIWVAWHFPSSGTLVLPTLGYEGSNLWKGKETDPSVTH